MNTLARNHAETEDLRWSLPKPDEEDFNGEITMAEKKAIRRTEWATWITLVVLLGGILFAVGQRDADVRYLQGRAEKAEQAALRAESDIAELKGDVKAIKAIMEQVTRKP